jgi:hypothetical protein
VWISLAVAGGFLAHVFIQLSKQGLVLISELSCAKQAQIFGYLCARIAGLCRVTLDFSRLLGSQLIYGYAAKE